MRRKTWFIAGVIALFVVVAAVVLMACGGAAASPPPEQAVRAAAPVALVTESGASGGQASQREVGGAEGLPGSDVTPRLQGGQAYCKFKDGVWYYEGILTEQQIRDIQAEGYVLAPVPFGGPCPSAPIPPSNTPAPIPTETPIPPPDTPAPPPPDTPVLPPDTPVPPPDTPVPPPPDTPVPPPTDTPVPMPTATPTEPPPPLNPNFCDVAPWTDSPITVRWGPSASTEPLSDRVSSLGYHAYTVLGRAQTATEGVWYQVMVGDQIGWVPGSAVRVGGDPHCDALPDLGPALEACGSDTNLIAQVSRLAAFVWQGHVSGPYACLELRDLLRPPVDIFAWMPDGFLDRFADCPNVVPGFVSLLRRLADMDGGGPLWAIGQALMQSGDACAFARSLAYPVDLPQDFPSQFVLDAAILACEPNITASRFFSLRAQLADLQVTADQLRGGNACNLIHPANLAGDMSASQEDFYRSVLSQCGDPVRAMEITLYAVAANADFSGVLGDADLCTALPASELVSRHPAAVSTPDPLLAAIWDRLQACDSGLVQLFIANHYVLLGEADRAALVVAPDVCQAIAAFLTGGPVQGAPSGATAGPLPSMTPTATESAGPESSPTATPTSPIVPRLLAMDAAYNDVVAVFLAANSAEAEASVYLLDSRDVSERQGIGPGAASPVVFRRNGGALGMIYFLDGELWWDNDISSDDAASPRFPTFLSAEGLVIDPDYRPAWSPAVDTDNVLITLSDERNEENGGIYALSLLGAAEPVQWVAGGTGPVFRSDGNAYLFEYNNHIWSRGPAAQGYAETLITDPNLVCDHPCFMPAYTPDENRVFFLCGNPDGPEQTLYLVDSQGRPHAVEVPEGVEIHNLAPGPIDGFVAFDNEGVIYYAIYPVDPPEYVFSTPLPLINPQWRLYATSLSWLVEENAN